MKFCYSFRKLLLDAMQAHSQVFDKDTRRLYVSKYKQYGFRHKIPLLSDSFNRFGLQFVEKVLRDKESFLPYSLTEELWLEIFGKKFNFYKFYSISKGRLTFIHPLFLQVRSYK